MNDAPARLHAFAGCGIELEYMIVDQRSLDVRPIADRLLRDLAGRQTSSVERDGLTWSNELALHVMEVCNTRPCADLADLSDRFAASVTCINRLLATNDARLMPTGTHPWMDPRIETHLWPHDNAEVYRAYERIFGCRTHGQANLQSMQINIPFADDAEFARLHAVVRLVLPILPALAASSPIADGVPRACLDFRLQSYLTQASDIPSVIGALIPERVDSRAEYEARILAPMYRAIAAQDPQGVLRNEWLNARGAIARFDRGAIEIRVIDAQEAPRADLAIASVVIALIKALYEERWAALPTQQAVAQSTLVDIFSRCVREADRATLTEPAYLTLFGYPCASCSAGGLWRHLIETTWPGTSGPGAAAVDTLLQHGPLARRILRAVGADCKRQRLQAVYRELCDCLSANRVFTGALH